jgi:pyruvate/2-oxoacid:ferredoxin oxidoreductase beta subunit
MQHCQAHMYDHANGASHALEYMHRLVRSNIKARGYCIVQVLKQCIDVGAAGQLTSIRVDSNIIIICLRIT